MCATIFDREARLKFVREIFDEDGLEHNAENVPEINFLTCMDVIDDADVRTSANIPAIDMHYSDDFPRCCELPIKWRCPHVIFMSTIRFVRTGLDLKHIARNLQLISKHQIMCISLHNSYSVYTFATRKHILSNLLHALPSEYEIEGTPAIQKTAVTAVPFSTLKVLMTTYIYNLLCISHHLAPMKQPTAKKELTGYHHTSGTEASFVRFYPEEDPKMHTTSSGVDIQMSISLGFLIHNLSFPTEFYRGRAFAFPKLSKCQIVATSKHFVPTEVFKSIGDLKNYWQKTHHYLMPDPEFYCEIKYHPLQCNFTYPSCFVVTEYPEGLTHTTLELRDELMNHMQSKFMKVSKIPVIAGFSWGKLHARDIHALHPSHELGRSHKRVSPITHWEHLMERQLEKYESMEDASNFAEGLDELSQLSTAKPLKNDKRTKKSRQCRKKSKIC